MTKLALIDPTDLLGDELRGALDRRPDLWQEIDLLTTDQSQVGVLSEAGGAAAVVRGFAPDSLDGVPVAFACGGERALRQVLAARPNTTRVVVVSPGAAAATAPAAVAGINLDAVADSPVLACPHPAALALAHLLAPWAGQITRATAVVILPASVHGREGLDELLEQTREILSFSGERTIAVFGHQLAFNLLPASDSSAQMEAELREVLGASGPRSLSVHTLQGGVFHGVSVALRLDLDAPRGVDTIVETVCATGQVRLADSPEHHGPIASAGQEGILLGRVEPDAGHPGSFWLWAVSDNLLAGAANALAIAERWLGSA